MVYQLFWEVVGMERGQLSLVRVIEELLEWKSSGSGQENRINGPGICCADHANPLSARVATNFAARRRSLGGLKATEFSFWYINSHTYLLISPTILISPSWFIMISFTTWSQLKSLLVVSETW
jgi:hypothetical protein